MIDIKITANKLDITECLDLAKDLGSGGIATFIGTVRNRTKTNLSFAWNMNVTSLWPLRKSENNR